MLHVQRSTGQNQPGWDPIQREKLLGHVNKAAAALKSHFGARRVILFGSLVDANRFTADSDIDLAVEGLESFDYWDAWWLCEELIQDRKVDLVPIERADESLVNRIERQGIEV